jgi:predicted transcriptional regulator
MNPIAEEMYAVLENDELLHYGMPRRSGRYPWGSGEDPYQRGQDFLSRVEELRKSGWKETPENIMEEFGLTTTQYRTEKSLAKDERRMYQVARAKSLAKDGKGPTEIGKEMGVRESTVRSWLDAESESRMMQARNTADFIRKQIETKGMIDVGAGAELELNISKEKMKEALYILEREGYPVYPGRFEQQTNRGNWTTQLVICPKGTPHKDIYQLDKVHALNEDNYISRDGGKTFEKKFHYPESMDSKRLMIRYKEDGGIDKDGIVELRRGVDDLSLGESRYSQVRILVDGTHYIKGMAVYSDNMPDGVDVVFNTNKAKGTPMKKVLKEIKEDPDNPFGSAIKDVEQGGQYWYTDKNGKRKLGLINKRADEGDWDEWADALPSQFLAKQSKTLAKKQLDLAKADKQAEFDAICELNNPTIKKHLLRKFADECDAAAVNLKAAALPGQKYHVIIPINTLKDTEVYAPGYEPGTKLALIRYPHGGTFEIPILTVNNKNATANRLLGKDVVDAVGINSKVAERLSGADFDGDTVMCIPTHDSKGRVKIMSKPPLKGLEGFDPKDKYGPDSYEGKNVRLMTKKGTQTQMGIISNLITDMTLAGADDNELAAAVRHSMVVIDAHKHKLDYKQSEVDNNIAALHKRYQGKATGGASTILSRSKGETSVDKRRGTPDINMKLDKKGNPNKNYDPSKPEGAYLYKTAYDADLYMPKRSTNKKTGIVTLTTTTGATIKYDPSDSEAKSRYAPVKKVNRDTGEVTYTDRSGKITYAVEKRKQKSTKMAETDDAYTLVSEARHPMEILYADYANSMKSLGNTARKTMMTTGKIEYSKTAAKTYSTEVSSLLHKTNEAEKNKTRERAAQRKTAAEIAAKKQAGLLKDAEDIKKASQRSLSKNRDEVGSVSRRERSIKITDKEWEAIQAGAISESRLTRILNNTDVDELRQRATPKTTKTVSAAQINRIKNMRNSNYTLEEIATKLHLSTSAVSKYLKEEI